MISEPSLDGALHDRKKRTVLSPLASDESNVCFDGKWLSVKFSESAFVRLTNLFVGRMEASVMAQLPYPAYPNSLTNQRKAECKQARVQ